MLDERVLIDRGATISAYSTINASRYASFAERPNFGNPAGVVLHAQDLSNAEMQRIATEIGYSETAFITSPLTTGTPLTARYFAPEGEVDFCGHATLATAVALGHELGFGDFALNTNVGPVLCSASITSGHTVGAFYSPTVTSTPIAPEHLDELLTYLNWDLSQLHPDYPPAIGIAGNLHPVIVVHDASQLAELTYDFDRLRALCLSENWTTIQLIAPTTPRNWHSRNPFPRGGVVEDPATGAAAAAFAGYLKMRGRLVSGEHFTITQGVEMGRPSRIDVELVNANARISGPVTPITTTEQANPAAPG
jgi:PhzF family phenazine biosynthesis protein